MKLALPSSAEEKLKALELELEHQKTRLTQAIQQTSDTLHNFVPSNSLSRELVGNVVQRYPFTTAAFLFVAGVCVVHFFYIDEPHGE